MPKLSLRLSSFLVLALLLVLYYVYRQFAPYDYDAIAQSESHTSLALLADSNPKKFVLFRQLQGAGFNNQARKSTHSTIQNLSHLPTGSRGGSVSSSSPLNVAGVRLSTSDMATSSCLTAIVRFPPGRHHRVYNFRCIRSSLSTVGSHACLY
jgi:hypothetical protein